ncbi:MAG: ribosome-associated translation inhibitor RaiA [Patescibacteria group bacterium]
MEIKFFTKDIKLVDALKIYIEKKIQVFAEKHLKNILEILEVRVELNVDHHHCHGKVQRIETIFYAPKQILIAEESANDIYTAIDMIVPKLETQVEKYKNKVVSKNRKNIAKN